MIPLFTHLFALAALYIVILSCFVLNLLLFFNLLDLLLYVFSWTLGNLNDTSCMHSIDSRTVVC